MLKPWTTCFQCGSHWYEMDEATYQKAKQALGPDWNNAKIVDKLQKLGCEFVTNPKNGFITVR